MLVQQNTQYKELADRFFNKIKDYDFCFMDEEAAYEIAIGYIDAACNHFQSCQQDLDNRDNVVGEFLFVLLPNNKEILVNYMVIEWLTSNYITTQSALKSRMSTTDFHKLDNNNLLAKAIEVRKSLKAENDQLAINRSYKNSELFDMVVNRNRKKV